MKIEVKLTQEDLSSAIRNFLTSKGIDTVGKTLDVSVLRGGSGATVELSDEENAIDNNSAPKSITPHHSNIYR